MILRKNFIRKRGRRLVNANDIHGVQLNRHQRQNVHNGVKRNKHSVNAENIVVNLSERRLTLTELAILNKGLNFCITNNNNASIDKTLIPEIDVFIRSLQLRYFFENVNNKAPPFTGNPEWNPPPSKCSVAINGYKQYLRKHIKKLFLTNKTKQNISQKDHAALRTLRLDKSIIIQKADKGGSIVVLNADAYKEKVLDMLSDEITYTSVDNINLSDAKREVDKIIVALLHDNYIVEAQYKFLTRCEPKMPIFYGLPKIHKPNWPLRPIVSQIDSPAYKLNKYLDYLLTTAEKCIPNLLQDTTKFLQIINALPLLNDNTILFTIDVTSLYTVLPHRMVIDYVAEMYVETRHEWLQYTPDIRPIPVNLLKCIIQLILNQTFFQFNDVTYCQNYGITMGAPSSVKLANITLYKHLYKVLHNYPGKMPDYHFRLIDDIFGVWCGTEAELLDWVKFLNDSHISIKFTVELSSIEIPFLDTLVYIDKNKLRTKLYKKPTDKKQYLHYHSEHPLHVKNSIPYAQALRYRRIIEDDTILNADLEKLKAKFISRNYPEFIIDRAINKVIKLNRSDIIQYKSKQDNVFNFTPFVLTFNNALVANKISNIYQLLTKSWQELLIAAPNLNFLNQPKIVFKRCMSVNNLLVSGMFPPTRWSKAVEHRGGGCGTIAAITPRSPAVSQAGAPCSRTRCRTCTHIIFSHGFRSTTYDKEFSFSENVNCDTANTVYLITCSICRLQYVGETSQTLRERMNGHRSCIRLNKSTPIGIHFNSIGHDLSALEITPIEVLNNDNFNDRKTREYFWQLSLGTIFPKGLNAFPVEHRGLFENFELTSAEDLEVFWTLKTLQLDAENSQ